MASLVAAASISGTSSRRTSSSDDSKLVFSSSISSANSYALALSAVSIKSFSVRPFYNFIFLVDYLFNALVDCLARFLFDNLRSTLISFSPDLPLTDIDVSCNCFEVPPIPELSASYSDFKVPTDRFNSSIFFSESLSE